VPACLDRRYHDFSKEELRSESEDDGEEYADASEDGEVEDWADEGGDDPVEALDEGASLTPPLTPPEPEAADASEDEVWLTPEASPHHSPRATPQISPKGSRAGGSTTSCRGSPRHGAAAGLAQTPYDTPYSVQTPHSASPGSSMAHNAARGRIRVRRSTAGPGGNASSSRASAEGAADALSGPSLPLDSEGAPDAYASSGPPLRLDSRLRTASSSFQRRRNVFGS